MVGRLRDESDPLYESRPYQYIDGVREVGRQDTFIWGKQVQPGTYIIYVEYYWENDSVRDTATVRTCGKMQVPLELYEEDPDRPFLDLVMTDCVLTHGHK